MSSVKGAHDQGSPTAAHAWRQTTACMVMKHRS
jgi:hypothetical protein